MRPLILISSLCTGGAERVTVSYLCRESHSCNDTFLCTVADRVDDNFKKELSDSGVVIHSIKARRLLDPVALLRLLYFIKKNRVDFIHAHGQDASILAAVAKLILGIPVIITRHVLDEPSRNWRERSRSKLALLAIRNADRVVAVSNAVAERLRDIAGISQDALKVIPNGVDLESFDRPDLLSKREAIRRSLGLNSEDKIVLVPAVLREGKGHELVIDTLSQLKARIPGLRFLFAGTGEHEGFLKRKAAPFGNAVIFLGQRDDIPQLLFASDLVLLPSLSEALPTCLIEAAAAGRPIVATCVGGIGEIIKDRVTGILIPPNDSDALVKALELMLNDYALARSFGESAKELAYRNFSIDVQVKRTIALWSGVVEGETL